MNIVHLLIGLGGGGAENFLIELITHTRRYPNTKILVVTISSIDTIGYKFDQNHIERVSLGIDGPKQLIPGVKKFLALIKREKATHIHAHMFHAGMLAVVGRLFNTGLKVIFTLHTNFVKQEYRKWLLYFTRNWRNQDVIFSDDSKRWYHKKNAVTIANGIDTTRYNLEKLSPELFTCLFLGRLAEPKNPLYLVDLVNALKTEFTFKIVIAGDGVLKDKLVQRIHENGIGRFFEFLGYRNDIPQLLTQVHCMITPSLWEGMPISMLEAGAAGVPIITTPVGSIPSLINADNGYIGELKEFHLLLKDVIQNYPSALEKAQKLKHKILEENNIVKCAHKHIDTYEKA